MSLQVCKISNKNIRESLRTIAFLHVFFCLSLQKIKLTKEDLRNRAVNIFASQIQTLTRRYVFTCRMPLKMHPRVFVTLLYRFMCVSFFALQAKNPVVQNSDSLTLSLGPKFVNYISTSKANTLLFLLE